MKKYKLFLFLAVVVLNFSLAQSRSERKAEKKAKTEAEYQALKELIASGEFQFEGDWAFPLGNDIARISNAFVGVNNVFQGNRVNLLGNTNFIKMKGNQTDFFLPYFGEVRRGLSYLGTGGDNGLKYEGEVEDYKIKYKDSKRQIDIKFTIHKPQEQLQMHLNISSGGVASVNINSSNRQSIRYQGKITILEKEETSKVAQN